MLSRAVDLFSRSQRILRILILVVAALPACSRRPVPLPSETPISTTDANQILEELQSKELSVARYQAVLKVRGRGPEGRFSATQVLVFERPDRMRVELLGVFGSTRWVTVATGDEILVYIPSRRQFLRETEVARVVGALLGVALGTEEIMSMLTGAGLPLERRRAQRAFRRGEIIRIELDRGSFEIDREQVRTATGPNYRVSYPTRWKEQGRQVPDRIDLEADGLEASLKIEDLDVNISIKPEVFTLVLPDDAQRVELHQIGGEAVFVNTERQ